MNNSLLRLISAALLAATVLTGCGGGGADVKQTTTTTTMGQELMDLNATYEKGIITQEEYEKAKEEIMDRYK